MVGATIESANTLESLLKVFSTPGHQAHAVMDADGEFVTDSDMASWPDDTANDNLNVADDVGLASKVGETDPTSEFIEDEGDNIVLDQASTSTVNTISNFAASKSGATHPEQGLPQDEDDSLPLDRSSSLRRSSANKISRFAASKSGATPSAWEWPQNGDDCIALDQTFFSLQSNVNKILLNTASTSDITDVTESKSASTDVDVGQFTYEYNPHEHNLLSYQAYTGYGNADGMGSESTKLRSSATPFVPLVRSPELHNTQRTTVLLRNIPKNLNTSRVVDWLNSAGYKGLFDFVDVPTNRVSKMTGGFAIVNLIHPAYAPFFWKTFDGFKQWTCKSKNICRVVWYDQLQGLHQILLRYKNLIIVNKGIPKKARPWLLNEGEWVPF
eukprot:TRINITY_DN5705_c0_g2_i3.p1 TRINITY_DN5705_c0_g2~~TRINITY_DN5705_c0_g2_i3.p1  ORF type:complete len:385 (+),score=43.31 TRINITY_DN5705_c0_g2_i3:58-1212(+)